MGEILDNFLKVYQLANFIKHSKLQEQLQQQELTQRQEEFRRRTASEDFNNSLHLAGLGATEITPGIEQVTGAMNEAFGPPQEANPRVTTPGGKDYYIPRYELQQQKLLDTIRAKGEAESGVAIGRAAAVEDVRQRIRAAYAKDPNLSFHTFKQGEDMIMVGTDPRSGEEKSRQVIKGAGGGNNVSLHSYTDEQTGTRYTEIRDPKTGQLLRKEEEKGAVTARPMKSAEKSPEKVSAGAKTAWAQFEKAKAAVESLHGGPEQAAALSNLVSMRDRIVLVYGSELDKGPSEGGWPDIVLKKQVAAAPAASDPKLKAYADKYFGGNVEKARAYAAAHP